MFPKVKYFPQFDYVSLRTWKKIYLQFIPKEGINGGMGQKRITKRITNLTGYVSKASNPSRPGKAEVRKHLSPRSEGCCSKWLMVSLNAAENGFCVHKCLVLLRLSEKKRRKWNSRALDALFSASPASGFLHKSDLCVVEALTSSWAPPPSLSVLHLVASHNHCQKQLDDIFPILPPILFWNKVIIPWIYIFR